MTDNCSKCKKRVRPRQEAICCSTCSRKTHRTCGTGISRQLYRQLVKNDQDVDWWCDDCGVPDGVVPDNPDDISLDESNTADEPVPVPGPVPVPRVPPVPVPRVAPVPVPRVAPVPVPRVAPVPVPRVAPVPVPRVPPIPTPRVTPKSNCPLQSTMEMDTTPDRIQFHISFNISDISVENMDAHNESNMDVTMNTSVVPEAATTFHIIDGGTKRGSNKLVSSDGYSYTVKKTTSNLTTWRCSVRSTTLWCRASVVQRRF